MRLRASMVTLAAAIATVTLLQSLPSSAAPSLVVGAGVWVTGGRVSTLEMVGLNPQPEPPSRTAFVLHTAGASAVVITITCAVSPASRTYLATGRGSNGRWYQIRIKDNGFGLVLTDSPRDIVGIASHAVPPNPCSDPGNARALLAGDFIVR